jgi:hypothetical protein
MQSNDEINIHLLSTLNYLELRDLCSSNKYYSNLCNNNNLKYILQNKNTNIVIPSNIDINKVLNNIYNEAAKAVDKSYDIPIWVDKTLFKKDMIYKILADFIDYFNTVNYVDEDTVNDYLSVYYVHNMNIIMPFTTKTMNDIEKQELSDRTDSIELHIPQSFYHYILPTLHYIYINSDPEKDLYPEFMEAFQDLLFMSNF